jgi:hypothetical protein
MAPRPGATAPTGVMPMVPSVGGILSMEGNATIEARRAIAQENNAKPVIQGLAGHVRKQWSYALDAKRQDVEQRMLKSLRQRRGEYDPEVIAAIKQMGGSEIFMELTSNKCRSAAAWIRDVMMGTSNDKPWTIKPTPEAELPPQVQRSAANAALADANAFTQATGLPVGPEYIARDAAIIYDRTKANAKKQATERMARMEVKMEDQLAEGGFHKALSEFINDLVTFPAAIIKGPVVRKKKKLKWAQGQDGKTTVQAEDYLCLEWERVDPFMAYPAPHASGVDDGDFIERHKLTRQALNEMKGVEGYNDASIDTVLDQYGRGGLSNWLDIDSSKAAAEGKSTATIGANTDGLIDALQYWGSVQGKLLVEWGMPETQVADQMKEYHCEVWLVGEWCIKATINADALGRKPYYKACYEEIPGAFWGNSVPDLCRDSQSQCNSAARAIANNMGIASGPQVTYNIDRLPPGQDLTQLYPWKVHQHTSDPYGSTSKAVDFFAPPMIAAELMAIYRFFSEMADEHTGIPRYMTGDATSQGGALRTSSGMSMLMQNAGKSIKQVIANIDLNAIEPLVSRLWYHNMVFSTDQELKGDVAVVARGATGLIIKETQQQRINEFLQLALTNPLVNQIVGEEAIAAMLRIAAKNLDMDTDQIVPPPEVIRARVLAATQAAAQEKQQQQSFAMAMATAPSQELKLEKGPDGEVLGMTIIDKQQHVLQDAGAVPAHPGLPMDAGKNAAKTMSSSGQGAVDTFSPKRTH